MPTDTNDMFSILRLGFMAALPVAGAALIVWSLVSLYLDLRHKAQSQILDRLNPNIRKDKVEATTLLRKERFTAPHPLERLLFKFNLIRRIQVIFEQANLSWSAPRFLMGLVFFPGGLLLVCTYVFERPWLGVFLALMALVFPFLYVLKKRSNRRKKLVAQLPEVFELISQALRAGHSLTSGFQMVGKQLPDPAGMEFARIYREQNMGIKIEDAMNNFAVRMDQLDVKLFVTAVLIQRQSGGNLTEILDNIGAVIRDRIEVLGQARTLTAEGRMSGWVLCALPLFMFILLWFINPEYIRILVDEKAGRYLLGAGIVMQFLGMLAIRKIVNIKV
jgi:tight adherence protein B